MRSGALNQDAWPPVDHLVIHTAHLKYVALEERPLNGLVVVVVVVVVGERNLVFGWSPDLLGGRANFGGATLRDAAYHRNSLTVDRRWVTRGLRGRPVLLTTVDKRRVTRGLRGWPVLLSTVDRRWVTRGLPRRPVLLSTVDKHWVARGLPGWPAAQSVNLDAILRIVDTWSCFPRLNTTAARPAPQGRVR